MWRKQLKPVFSNELGKTQSKPSKLFIEIGVQKALRWIDLYKSRHAEIEWFTEHGIFLLMGIFLNGQTQPRFSLFSFISQDRYNTNLTINDKSIDGVLRTWTRGCRIVGTGHGGTPWWKKLVHRLLLQLNLFFP